MVGLTYKLVNFIPQGKIFHMLGVHTFAETRKVGVSHVIDEDHDDVGSEVGMPTRESHRQGEESG